MSVSVTETITMETRLTLESSPATQTEPTQSRSPEFDQKVAELEDWLTLLNHMLRSSRVMVADIADIEETSFKHKVSVLQWCSGFAQNLENQKITKHFFTGTPKLSNLIFLFCDVILWLQRDVMLLLYCSSECAARFWHQEVRVERSDL